MKTRLILCLAILMGLNAAAQNPVEDRVMTTNFPKPKKIVNSYIPGTPVLGQPQRIDGSLQEIRTEKHGLAYPAFFDWDGDGKKDLLLGEFETGETGSYIKVYLNVGTDSDPKYTGEYFYATDVNGDKLTNYQWCCIGIHPRVIDFDGDGYLDILSGQYNPGAITWWRGSAKGFLPGVLVDQEGFVNKVMGIGGSNDPESPECLFYWNYTSADFADFDGDGLIDLFVGGSGGLRVALNVGTKDKPKFGLRKYLYHTDGTLLSVNREKADGPGHPSVHKTYIHPVDWDGDDVLDILMTHEYSNPGHNAIEFFKGVQTPDGLRFEKPVPLFTAEDGSKSLPGCQPMITVVDYNNDGVPDIVFGLSVPTINGFEAAPEVAWDWASSLGIQLPGKDSGQQLERGGTVEDMIKQIEAQPFQKRFLMGKLEDYKYLTLRHRGYVFVMYGAKRQTGDTGAMSPPAIIPAKPIGGTHGTTTGTMGMDAAGVYGSGFTTVGGTLSTGGTAVIGASEGVSASSSGMGPASDDSPFVAVGPVDITKMNIVNMPQREQSREPVSFGIELPEEIEPGKEYTAKVVFTFAKGWHGYSDDKGNAAMGFIPTTAEFIFPKGVKTGKIICSEDCSMYEGSVSFTQTFICPKNIVKKDGSLPVTANLQWQVCDEDMCLPPESRTVEKAINFI